MGNPEAGSSDYQPQSEYELQPQDYQYEATHEAMASQDPQAQQQLQPPQPYPPSSQPNQAAYGAQSGRLFPPFDPRNNQTYGQNQSGAYSPYNQMPMPAPQSLVNFPPTGPQATTGMQFLPNNGPQAPYGVPLTSQGKLGNGWHSELFDCMNDPMNAFVTILFPCLTFGQIAKIVNDGHTYNMWDERNAIRLGCVLHRVAMHNFMHVLNKAQEQVWASGGSSTQLDHPFSL
ncbi:hypothetical protein Pint_16440 [Pistacia integerrima]|uniref:Uncharacterized protein n=1 Tax=Pistacia integerrima TaxID=434235 RepID=A0ACC0ZDQ3_9ROSI|nr:hypothetical protein Pint_16440 [Pistacia integerrima]